LNAPRHLFDKVWDAHTVGTLGNGQTQLLIGTHLIHEVTSPQAFGMLDDLGLRCGCRTAPSPRSTTSCPPTSAASPSPTRWPTP
jgi:homoaconitase/3-isopropylmalate dehydratase large subunit